MANSPLTYGPKVSSGKSLPDGITPYMVIRHEEANRMAARTSGRVSVTDPDYGADPTGAVDSGAAINACMAAVSAAGGGTVYFPGGTYLTSVLLALPYNVSLFLEPDAAIKATTAMEAVIQTPLNTLAEQRYICGGAIYCNALANCGIDVQYARRFHLTDCNVHDSLVAGYRYGNSGAGGTSYQIITRGCDTHRTGAAPGVVGATVPAGSIGMHFRYATDCQTSQCNPVGSDIGVQIEAGSGGRFIDVHPWSRASVGNMSKAFYDLSNANTFIGCYADTPTTYGFHLGGSDTQLIGCTVYNSASGSDNLLVGVHYDNLAPNGAVIACEFKGADSSHRILRDIDFNGGTGQSTTVIGLQHQNCSNNASNALTQSTGIYNSLSVSSLFIGLTGTRLTRFLSGTATWDPPSVAAGAQTTTTVTVNGAALGDTVTVSFSLDLQAMRLTGHVSAANTVTAVLANGTGGAIDLASGTIRADVWQH